MKHSEFLITTSKEAPKDEESLNAKLLTRAGFISKVGAGIYSYFPLGLRVLQNVASIVRKEMDAIGGNEVLLPALHPKEYWSKTGRWETLDVLYRIKAKEKREYALGSTHEEIIVPLAKQAVQSYKDLPRYFYQIQTKFRDEPRAKSGLLRGREFLMKDLYSFHAGQDDLDSFYETKVVPAYEKIFKQCGLNAIRTKASGGSFSKYSDEYQVTNDSGEDVIFYCNTCGFALNREIIEDEQHCLKCRGRLEKLIASEVGNIFKLGTKYSKPFQLTYQDHKGEKQDVLMGCYGIGVSRLMGVIAEIHNDKKGLVWPESVAPFRVHMLKLTTDEKRHATNPDDVYHELMKHGIDVLYDDRNDVSAGAKLMEADLIGMPLRIVMSDRTLKEDRLEIKQRSGENTWLYDTKATIKILTSDNLKKLLPN